MKRAGDFDWPESVTEKETGNAQSGACVDVLPRCWSSQLFDLRASSLTEVPVLLQNQPNKLERGLEPTKTEVNIQYSELEFFRTAGTMFQVCERLVSPLGTAVHTTLYSLYRAWSHERCGFKRQVNEAQTEAKICSLFNKIPIQAQDGLPRFLLYVS